MVTIDNAVIVGLTANSAIAREFPFLMSARQNFIKSGGCCGGKQQGTDFNAIKIALATMPGEAQARFKKLTGWNQVRVIYATGAGTFTKIF